MTYVVKVPLASIKSETNGCEKAGNAIIKEMDEIWANDSLVPVDSFEFDLEEIHLDESDIELSNKLIYENAFEIFETKRKTIFLGGDHSISYSIGKAFLDYCNSKDKEPCLIVFDSHPDCMPITSLYPNHEEWLSSLIERGFPAENILIIGVRNPGREEIIFLKEKKIKMLNLTQFLLNIEDAGDIITEFPNGKELYVSLDIDVVDPAFAPAVRYKEPGGLSSRELIYILQRINKIKNLRAVDIVEINPDLDKKFDNLTVKLGAKIVAELVD